MEAVSRSRAHKLWEILSAPHSAGSLAFLAFVLGVIVNRATGVETEARFASSVDTIVAVETGRLVPCTAEFLGFAKSSKLIWMEHGIVLGSVLCTLISIAVAAFARGWHVKGAFAATSTVVMLETIAFYLILHTGNTSVLCVSEGDGHIRAEIPLRYVWWACTTVQFEAAMYKMVGGVPAPERALALLAAILGIAAGYGAASTPVNSAQSLTLLVTSFALTGYMLVVRSRILLQLSKWPVEKSALKRATLFAIPLTTVLAIGMIPAVWVATYAKAAPLELTMVLFCLPEVLSKCAMCNLLSWSDLPQHMDTLRLQLLEAEALRVGSQAKETAMRSIMRYLFHELRVPLNSIVLGLNDTSEALEDMLGVLEGEGLLPGSPRAGAALLPPVKAVSLQSTTQESTATGTKGSTTGHLPSPLSVPAPHAFRAAAASPGDVSAHGPPSSHAHAATGNPSSAGVSEGAHSPHAVTSTAAYGASDRSQSAGSSSTLNGAPVASPSTIATGAAAAAAAGGAISVRSLHRVHSGLLLAAGSRAGTGAPVGGTGLDVARLWSLGSAAHQALSPSSTNVGGGGDELVRDACTPSSPASAVPVGVSRVGGRPSSQHVTAASDGESSKGGADPAPASSVSRHRNSQSPKVTFAMSAAGHGAGGVKEGGGGGWKSRDASLSPTGRSRERDQSSASSSTGTGTQDVSITAQHATVVSLGTQRAVTANQASKAASSATLTWGGVSGVGVVPLGVAGRAGGPYNRGAAGSGEYQLGMEAQHGAPLNCTNDALMVGLKDVTHILAMCKTSALGLGRLLDDFLSLDKIEQGQLQVELGTVQVKRMVDETLRLFQPAVDSKKLQIKRVAHRRVPATIVGDDHKLRQCLANFVSNAIKFSPPGGKVAVHISIVYAPPKSQFEEVSGPTATPRGIAGAPGPTSGGSTPTSVKQAGERARAGSSQMGGSRISMGSAGGGSVPTPSRAAGRTSSMDLDPPLSSSQVSLPVLELAPPAHKGPSPHVSHTAKRPPAVLTAPLPPLASAAVAVDVDAQEPCLSEASTATSEDLPEAPQLGGQRGGGSTGKSTNGLLMALLARVASAWATSMRYVSAAVVPANPRGEYGRGGSRGAVPGGFELSSTSSPVGSDTGSRHLGGASTPLGAGFGAGRVRDAPARVYAEQQEGTVAYLKVSVEDQGVGISPADQAKLFQPFQQIRAGALQKGNGTGLGLSIVRQIINLSGGFVSVESSEGKGSTFSFCVPVTEHKPPAHSEPAGPAALSARPPAPFSGRRMSSSRESSQKGGVFVLSAEGAPGPVPVPVQPIVSLPAGTDAAPMARGSSSFHNSTAIHVHDSSGVMAPVSPAHPYSLQHAHARGAVVPHPPKQLGCLREEDGHELSTGTEATAESGSWLFTAAPTSRSTARMLASTLIAHHGGTGRGSARGLSGEVEMAAVLGPCPGPAQGISPSKVVHDMTGLVETSSTGGGVSAACSPALGPLVDVSRGVPPLGGGQPQPHAAIRVPHLHIHSIHGGVGSLQTIMSVGEMPTTASQEGEGHSTEGNENGAGSSASGSAGGGAVPQDASHTGHEGRAQGLRKQSVTVVSLRDVLDPVRGEASSVDILGSARTPVHVSSGTPAPVAASEGSAGAGVGRGQDGSAAAPLNGPTPIPAPATVPVQPGFKAAGRLSGSYSEPEREAWHRPQPGHLPGTVPAAGASTSGSAGQGDGPGWQERRRGSKETPLALDVPLVRSPLARHQSGPASTTPSAAAPAAHAGSRGWVASAASAGYSANSPVSVSGSVEEAMPVAGRVKLTRAVVVDDIASNRQLLVRMLKRRGVLECYEAADGTEVLAIADQLAAQGKLHSIQAWFLDEEMPIMNGSTAIAALRGAQYSVTAVMLSVTGNALEEDQAALVTAGANAVLPKPVQVDALEGLLVRHGGLRLGQRRGSIS